MCVVLHCTSILPKIDIDDFAPAIKVVDKTITFRYTVTTGDTNSRLDYSDTTSIDESLGQIFRASTNPSTHATVTLPAPGALGSLSFSRAIEVNTKAPVVKSIEYKSLTPGIYGAGEVVDIDLKFDFPVTVYGEPGKSLGTPFIELRSARTLLFDAIVAIPGDLKAIYANVGNPGTASEISVSFYLGAYLVPGNRITLTLPGFSSDHNITSIDLSGADANFFDASWDTESQALKLTVQKNVEYRNLTNLIEIFIKIGSKNNDSWRRSCKSYEN